jgi:hypothetical protein
MKAEAIHADAPVFANGQFIKFVFKGYIDFKCRTGYCTEGRPSSHWRRRQQFFDLLIRDFCLNVKAAHSGVVVNPHVVYRLSLALKERKQSGEAAESEGPAYCKQIAFLYGTTSEQGLKLRA